jgi:hypothetical protein
MRGPPGHGRACRRAEGRARCCEPGPPTMAGRMGGREGGWKGEVSGMALDSVTGTRGRALPERVRKGAK